jgi:microcystin-dependent protein
VLGNGQLLTIDQNQALFSLLGTTFGVTYSGCDAASRLNKRECRESRNPDKDSGVWWL